MNMLMIVECLLRYLCMCFESFYRVEVRYIYINGRVI